ncbi:hypothetical protein GO986_11435 [Deinococcus sp. HMF7620]|uniref:Uncharacterized protein n=1 Tax=Deinococcus arboris TaxID=2682977 RepID=A0A7C9LUL4_9DEIO|nr:hypothetical protein [Deinococcus arboris]MVN87380.1 hypothetical protein [Deinococcus arboris]
MTPEPSRPLQRWHLSLLIAALGAYLMDWFLIPGGQEWRGANYAFELLKLALIGGWLYVSYPRRWFLITLAVVWAAIGLITWPRNFNAQ